MLLYSKSWCPKASFLDQQSRRRDRSRHRLAGNLRVIRKISAPVKPEIVAITDGDVDIDRPCACQQGRRLVGSDPIVAGYHLERFGRVE